MRKTIARLAWFGAVINAGMPVIAATFTVTSTNDVGAGTLRQAILEANATNIASEIVFDIPGAGPHTLYLFPALPIITNSVTIDGFTQPGSRPNTRIYGNNSELRIRVDPSAQGFAGFHIQTNFVTIRGLSIIRSEVAAVYSQTEVSNVGQVFRATLIATSSSPNETNVFLLIPVSLQIERAGPAAAVSWLTDLSEFSLQSAIGLNQPGDWSTVAGAPHSIVGDRFYYTNNVSEGARYFRLFKP